MKRYTAVGMGPSQGKHSNMYALRVLARPPESTSATVAPPPRGRCSIRCPCRIWQAAASRPSAERPSMSNTPRWERCGCPPEQWRRPEYYAILAQSCYRHRDEVVAVRNGVGLIDVGTLGKIETHGPQAAEFLERVYAGGTRARIGMTRYGLMSTRAASSWTTASSRGSRPSSSISRRRQDSGADLPRVRSPRTAWGLPAASSTSRVIRRLQPRRPCLARRARHAYEPDLDLSAFPYLGACAWQVAGIPCRLLRVGFVGEMAYEIHLAAGRRRRVWQALLAAGARFGIRPFGVEAQRRLRLEKGHIIIGQDTDGLTNPFEVGARVGLEARQAVLRGPTQPREPRATATAPATGGVSPRAVGVAPSEGVPPRD